MIEQQIDEFIITYCKPLRASNFAAAKQSLIGTIHQVEQAAKLKETEACAKDCEDLFDIYVKHNVHSEYLKGIKRCSKRLRDKIKDPSWYQATKSDEEQLKPHENVIMEISRERERQIGEEGRSLEHDDKHTRGQMAKAAACYAYIAGVTSRARAIDDFERERYGGSGVIVIRRAWPWSWKWWKPKDRRIDLIRAGALIVAEIERLDRIAVKQARVALAKTKEKNDG